jgi:hypothetical protein
MKKRCLIVKQHRCGALMHHRENFRRLGQKRFILFNASIYNGMGITATGGFQIEENFSVLFHMII